MAECWLKPNRRALGAATFVPSVAALIGLVLFASNGGSWWRIVGGATLALGISGIATLWFASRIPRLAYDEGNLLVYLRSLTPLRVPVEAVECFFLGQGPALPVEPQQPVAKTANVIVRIAESAAEWHERNVRPDLGIWRDGYITIRGLWCEPLSHERVNMLNQKLSEAHRAARCRQEMS